MEHLALLNASGPVADQLIFQRWLESLDTATAKIMRVKASENPSINSYTKLWNELDAKMGRNASQSQRGKLESLQLSWSGRVTMKDFELFDAQFRVVASDQSFLSQREASFAYARKLPHFLLEKWRRSV